MTLYRYEGIKPIKAAVAGMNELKCSKDNYHLFNYYRVTPESKAITLRYSMPIQYTRIYLVSKSGKQLIYVNAKGNIFIWQIH